MINLEVPGRAHPAALTTPVAVILAEILLILTISCKCAINKVLLRETNGSFVSLLGNSTLKGSVRTERPAGAAVSLVLNSVHEAICKVINVGGSLHEMSLSVGTSSHFESSRLLLCLLSIKTEKIKILLASHSRGPVVLQAEHQRVVTGFSLSILSRNDIVIFSEDFLSQLEVRDGIDLCVEGTDMGLEKWVLSKLSEAFGIEAARSSSLSLSHGSACQYSDTIRFHCLYDGFLSN